MSDNSNLANSNNEPSMEDILSSIRKVIAEDLVNEETISGEDISEQIAEDVAESIEEISTSDETSHDEVNRQLDPLADSDVETTLPDTESENILELESIVTELPDPLAIATEMGEALELVTLEGDQVSDLADDTALDSTNESTDNLIDSLMDDLGADQEIELEDVLHVNETNTNTAEDADEMDIAISADVNIVAQAEAIEQADTNNTIDFDDALDLVMDSDASDYVTANLMSKTSAGLENEERQQRAPEITNPEKAAFEDIVSNELDTEGASADILALSSDADAELQATVDKAVQKTLAETLAEETMDEETVTETTSYVEPELAQAGLTALDLHPDLNEPESAPTAATPDEDMDLVKSLLDDLMDEPAPETEQPFESETIIEVDAISLEDDADITDFTNEILFRDDVNHRLDDQDILIPEPPDNSNATDAVAVEDTQIDPISETQNTLAQIAKDVGKTSETSADNISNPDDIVTLEVPDLISQLALASGVAGTAGLTSDAPDELEQDALEPDALESDQITQEQTEQVTTEIEPETPIFQTPQPSIQEEEPMATPLKTDSLSGSRTQEDAGSAFASLTSAVQDKALAEENGPPIGELVKEALKPMLQEWLDANLKAMVQRAVTKEIKRISSGK